MSEIAVGTRVEYVGTSTNWRHRLGKRATVVDSGHALYRDRDDSWMVGIKFDDEVQHVWAYKDSLRVLSDVRCPTCDSDDYLELDGCMVCNDCGFSK